MDRVNKTGILRQYMFQSCERNDVFITEAGNVMEIGGTSRGVSPDGSVWFSTNGSPLPNWTTPYTTTPVPSDVLFVPFSIASPRSDARYNARRSECTLDDYARQVLMAGGDIKAVLFEYGTTNPIDMLCQGVQSLGLNNAFAAKKNPNMFQFKNGVLFNLNFDRERDVCESISDIYESNLGFIFVEWDDAAGFKRLRKKGILQSNDTPHKSFPDVWFDRTVLSTNAVVDVYIPHLRCVLAHQNYYYDHVMFNNVAGIFGLMLCKPRGAQNVAFVVLGEANTGKSMMLKVVQMLVPKMDQATMQFGEGRSEAHGWSPLVTNLSLVKNSKKTIKPKIAELLYTDEMPIEFGRGLDWGKFKTALSGGVLQINPKGVDEFPIPGNFNCLFCSNHVLKIPNEKEWDTLHRRILYLPFPNDIKGEEFGGSANRDESLFSNLYQNSDAILVSLLSRASEILRRVNKAMYLRKYLDPRLVKYTDMKFRLESKVCTAIMVAVECGWVKYPDHNADNDDGKRRDDAKSSAIPGASLEPVEDPYNPKWVPLSKMNDFISMFYSASKKRIRHFSNECIQNEIGKVWNIERNPHWIRIEKKYSTFSFMGKVFTNDKKVMGLWPGPEMKIDMGVFEPSMDAPVDEEEDNAHLTEGSDQSLLSRERMIKVSKMDFRDLDPAGLDFGKAEEDKKERNLELRFLKKTKITKNIAIGEHISRMVSKFIKTNKKHRCTSYLTKMIQLFKKLSSQYKERAALDRGPTARENAPDISSGRTLELSLQHPMVTLSRSKMATLKNSTVPDWRSRRMSQATNEEKHTNIEHIHSVVRQLNIKMKSSVSHTTLVRTLFVLNTLTVARFGLHQLDGLMSDCKVAMSTPSGVRRQLRAYAHWKFLLKLFFGYDIAAPVDKAQSSCVNMAVYSPLVTQWCARLARIQRGAVQSINEMVQLLAVGHLQSATTYCLVGGARELFAPLFDGVQAVAAAAVSLLNSAPNEQRETRVGDSHNSYPFLLGLSEDDIVRLYAKAIEGASRADDDAEVILAVPPQRALSPVKHALSAIGALLYDESLCTDENYKFVGHADIIKHCMNMTETNPKRGYASPSKERLSCSQSVANAIHTILSAVRSNAVCAALRNAPDSKILETQIRKDPTLKKLTRPGAELLAIGDNESMRESLGAEVLFLDPYTFDVGGLVDDLFYGETKRTEQLCAMRVDRMELVLWTTNAVHPKFRSVGGMRSCIEDRSEAVVPLEQASSAANANPVEEDVPNVAHKRRRESEPSSHTEMRRRKKGRSSIIPEEN